MQAADYNPYEERERVLRRQMEAMMQQQAYYAGPVYVDGSTYTSYGTCEPVRRHRCLHTGCKPSQRAFYEQKLDFLRQASPKAVKAAEAECSERNVMCVIAMVESRRF